MSETLHLARIETASGVSQAGKNWTRWDFIDDQNNKIGSTFQAALGNSAQAHIGGLVDVERNHDGKGYKVTAIRPAANGGSPTPAAPAPAPGNGQFFRPRDPRESRSIIRQTALKAAATVAAGMTVDVGTQDVLGLASSFETWLTRPLPEDVGVGGQAEEVPFG